MQHEKLGNKLYHIICSCAFEARPAKKEETSQPDLQSLNSGRPLSWADFD